MKAEWIARLGVLLVLLGLPVGVWQASRMRTPPGVIELNAALPETGGWSPGSLQAVVGQPLHLRLTSSDVTHSFAVGQSDRPPVDIYPGKVSEVTLAFDRPGKYTFYCTRWCGADHWRMRGTIEVSGPAGPVSPVLQPLYLQLGLDLDAPPVDFPAPPSRPSARRGRALEIALPNETISTAYVRRHSPLELFQAIRQMTGVPAEPTEPQDPANRPVPGLPGHALTDQEVWDLVAWTWQSAGEAQTPERSPESLLAQGRRLYATNCAACHGEAGAGDGVMAAASARQASGQQPLGRGMLGTAPQEPEQGGHGAGLPAGEAGVAQEESEFGHSTEAPTDFSDLAMLGRSSARLQGKILRGGMGTGMPYWGPIFTEAETWALVHYLWSLAMDY